MYIFQRDSRPVLAASKLRAHLLQARVDGRALLRREQADLGQHRAVGEGAVDVLLEHLQIHAQRLAEALHLGGRAALESSIPESHGPQLRPQPRLRRLKAGCPWARRIWAMVL